MEQNRTNVVILGSTGSIGLQTLDVIQHYPDLFNVVGIAAKDEASTIIDQIGQYRPLAVAVGDNHTYGYIKDRISGQCSLLQGIDGLCEIAALPQADVVVVAVSGSIGIKPTLSAIEAGKKVALANKETLVAAGDIVMNRALECNTPIIPVDSEHSAVFQCLKNEHAHLKKIWLTASGGPFHDLEGDALKKITPEMALKHPTWVMGPKITVDSATLMNKGLEVIEAHHLFAADYHKISVVVHKESIIHSMIELLDGSYLAQLGSHDMRIPIQYALTYPDRMESPARPLDLISLGRLSFMSPDTAKFPALSLAYEAGKTGGTMPAVMNAANEIAVNEFLNSSLSFTGIPAVVEKVMMLHDTIAEPTLDDIVQTDRWAREISRELCRQIGFTC